MFKTKALAVADAHRAIQGNDYIGYSQEYWRRLLKRGTECQFTAEDLEALERAGRKTGSHG
jgi:hypothetical protein